MDDSGLNQNPSIFYTPDDVGMAFKHPIWTLWWNTLGNLVSQWDGYFNVSFVSGSSTYFESSLTHVFLRHISLNFSHVSQCPGDFRGCGYSRWWRIAGFCICRSAALVWSLKIRLLAFAWNFVVSITPTFPTFLIVIIEGGRRAESSYECLCVLAFSPSRRVEVNSCVVSSVDSTMLLYLNASE
jgi:hypothetical protein